MNEFYIDLDENLRLCGVIKRDWLNDLYVWGLHITTILDGETVVLRIADPRAHVKLADKLLTAYEIEQAEKPQVEVKNTPGPWKIIDDDMDYIAITDEEQNFGICRLDQVSSESREAMVANAHLISAALDLYCALEHSLDLLNNSKFSPFLDSPLLTLRDEIKSALNKANGKS